MTNKVLVTPYFEQRYKRFAKKFPSIDNDLGNLENELLKNPKLGQPLGANLYKIRMVGKGRGKSGGFRIITYVVLENDQNYDVYLMTMYDKSEESTITKTTLLKLVKTIFG